MTCFGGTDEGFARQSAVLALLPLVGCLSFHGTFINLACPCSQTILSPPMGFQSAAKAFLWSSVGLI